MGERLATVSAEWRLPKSAAPAGIPAFHCGKDPYQIAGVRLINGYCANHIVSSMPMLSNEAAMKKRVPLTILLCAATLWSAPLRAQDSVRFAAFGDYGPDGSGTGTTDVAEMVNDDAPDFIISLGDQCYGSSPPIATQVGKPYGQWVDEQRFWPILGNHEFSDACGGGNRASGYRTYFNLPNNERYYDIVIGPVHFFALNSATEPDGKEATSVQGQWLRSRLTASTSPWKVVIVHHPPFSSGPRLAKMRWPFEAWGVDVVLSGHSHHYERIHKDDNADGVTLPYFISGLGGASKGSFSSSPPGSIKRYNAEYGAMFVTATATSMNFEFRNIKGAVIDTYSMTKTAAQPTTDFQWVIPPK